MSTSKVRIFVLSLLIGIALAAFSVCASAGITDSQSLVPDKINPSSMNETISDDTLAEYDWKGLFEWLYYGGNWTGSDDILVVCGRGGGYAGMSEDIVIFNNGTTLWVVKNSWDSDRDTVFYSINQSEMDVLESLLSDTSFSTYNDSYITPYPPYSDGYSYSVTYLGKTIYYDGWVEMPPEFNNLTEFLDTLYYTLSGGEIIL